MINKLTALVFNAAEGPKCIYHSSTNGRTYCLAENHQFRITILDPVGEVEEIYEPVYQPRGPYAMLDKLGKFNELVSGHINRRGWVE